MHQDERRRLMYSYTFSLIFLFSNKNYVVRKSSSVCVCVGGGQADKKVRKGTA